MYNNQFPQQNPFGQFQNFQQQYSQFANNFQQNSNGMDPQMVVQNMLNTGQMSQQQFNQCRMMANQIMGVNM